MPKCQNFLFGSGDNCRYPIPPGHIKSSHNTKPLQMESRYPRPEFHPPNQKKKSSQPLATYKYSDVKKTRQFNKHKGCSQSMRRCARMYMHWDRVCHIEEPKKVAESLHPLPLSALWITIIIVTRTSGIQQRVHITGHATPPCWRC